MPANEQRVDDKMIERAIAAYHAAPTHRDMGRSKMRAALEAALTDAAPRMGEAGEPFDWTAGGLRLAHPDTAPAGVRELVAEWYDDSRSRINRPEVRAVFRQCADQLSMRLAALPDGREDGERFHRAHVLRHDEPRTLPARADDLGQGRERTDVARGVRQAHGSRSRHPPACARGWVMGATLLRAMAKNYAGGHAWDDLDAKACTEAADHIDALAARVAELENEVREANGRADAHEKLAESCFNDAVRFRWAAESKQFQYWLSTNSPDEARAAIDAAITAAGTGGGE